MVNGIQLSMSNLFIYLLITFLFVPWSKMVHVALTGDSVVKCRFFFMSYVQELWRQASLFQWQKKYILDLQTAQYLLWRNQN